MRTGRDKMPSPTKITATDLLNSRTPSPNNEQLNKNKQLHIMSSATNYGFLRENSPPSLDNFAGAKENQHPPVTEAKAPNNCGEMTGKQQTASAESALQEKELNYKSVKDTISDLLPVDIVVYDNREYKKGNSVENLEREGLLNNRECLKLQDLRIHENPLVNVSVSPSGRGSGTPEATELRYSSISRSKPQIAPSKRRFQLSWLRSTTPLEKYLTSSLIILILFFSLIFLSLYRTNCTGKLIYIFFCFTNNKNTSFVTYEMTVPISCCCM